MNQDVRSRLGAVRDRIGRAAERAGRDPATVLLVAVSKGVSADTIPPQLFSDLGENRVSELLAKQARVLGPDLRWHFIGTLQRNKAARVTGRVSVIHSVDNVRLADAIARAATSRGAVQDVLIQVNTSREATKHGVAPADAPALASAASGLQDLIVRGFMTMAPAGDLDGARACFAALRSIRDHARATIPTAVELSMGMTGDFEVAIEEGATIVRVGSAIFGARPPT